jgi:hypothetical protein
MKKSAKFFGKSLLALALGVIAVAGLAVAGLLSYYGKVVGTANVAQSLLVDGNTYSQEVKDNLGNIVAGESYIKEHYLKNQATQEGVVAKAKLTPDDPSTTDVEKYPDGVTVTYYKATWTDANNNGEVDSGEIACSTTEAYSSDDIIEVGAGQVVPFCIKYTFAVNLEPSTSENPYTITTYVAVTQ